ncbi:hypothetical protein RRF57_007286 [Xylaria bambusicola]|uniref:Sm domain-containing protein n=1 Tax=Xylaria bambusicola TaxID=326684 RepID=A0AAN7UMI4_9PEZI
MILLYQHLKASDAKNSPKITVFRLLSGFGLTLLMICSVSEAVTEQLGRATMSEAFSKAEAEAFLRSLLNKILRIQVTDGRLFTGTFKCTDTDSNVVISNTFEYRHPSQREIAEAASAAADDANAASVKVDMTSRYLGLVVVPGKHIPATTPQPDKVPRVNSLYRHSKHYISNGEALSTKRERHLPEYFKCSSANLLLR